MKKVLLADLAGIEPTSLEPNSSVIIHYTIGLDIEKY